jgi:hypothetical protein
MTDAEMSAEHLALRELQAEWPGYDIDFDGRNWTAQTGTILLCSGFASVLDAMIQRHAAARAFSSHLRVVGGTGYPDIGPEIAP